MNLVRATSTIGGLTLVSRVLGMVRDMLMARFVGAGLASDAFLIAWRLPNLFRALVCRGRFRRGVRAAVQPHDGRGRAGTA